MFQEHFRLDLLLPVVGKYLDSRHRRLVPHQLRGATPHPHHGRHRHPPMDSSPQKRSSLHLHRSAILQEENTRVWCACTVRTECLSIVVGPFIVMLTLMTSDFVKFALIYIEFFIPFSKTFKTYEFQSNLTGICT